MKAFLVILLVVIVAGGVFLYYPRATGTAATGMAGRTVPSVISPSLLYQNHLPKGGIEIILHRDTPI